MATSSGTKSGSLARHAEMAEQHLGLLTVGFVHDLDAPPLRRLRLAHRQGIGTGGGGAGQGGKQALHPRGEIIDVDVTGRGDDDVGAHHVAAVVDHQIVSADTFQTGAISFGRMPVGVIAVQVADEKALAQRLIVVPRFLDVGQDLPARPRKLRRRKNPGATGHPPRWRR